jgi:AraC-like DNA-binding protein
MAYRKGNRDPGWYEERLTELLALMWGSQQSVWDQIARLPAVRASTRDELFRRLLLARDYMNASLAEPLTLESIAAVAALSPYHFLRTFQQAYGETPHSYLTRKRIERARFLLRHSEESVTSICLAVGFSSLGSFSSLFLKQTGVSPTGYRLSQAAS